MGQGIMNTAAHSVIIKQGFIYITIDKDKEVNRREHELVEPMQKDLE